MIRVEISDRLRTLAETYAREVARTMDDVALDLADKLQQESPRDTGALAGGWDVIPATRRRNSLAIRSVVRNRAPNALFRIVGRAPGTPPPIAAVAPWARRKGISPFLVARAIGRRGTQRWRDKENILGLDPVTQQYQPDSPVLEAQREVVRRLNQIRI